MSTLTLYQRKLLTAPFERSGLILRFEKEQRVGLGEIAPLPGWSRETLEQARAQIEQILHDNQPAQLFPSVAFGLQSALADLYDPLPPFSVEVNALLMGSKQEILLRAEAAKNAGFSAAKLKLGALSTQDALSIISELKEQFSLRIDCNRAFSLQEAREFFSHFAPDAFDYIEEPLRNPLELFLFPYPVALDDTLREPYFEELLQLPHLKALILKPTLLGDISAHVEIAKKHGLQTILSSSFESSVGIRQIACLAKRLTLPDLPLGLDTHRYLEHDPTEPPLCFLHGRLHILTQNDERRTQN